jgi:hypothetical protein
MRGPQSFCFSKLVVVGAGVLLTVPSYGEALPATEAEATDRPAAVVSDRTDSAKAEAALVAREVLELQRQMGGSIVPGFGGDFAEQDILEPAKTTKPMPGKKSPVAVLRAGSWQLERLAYRLENLNLYPQADVVRQTATKLRLDARRLQAESERRVSPGISGP